MKKILMMMTLMAAVCAEEAEEKISSVKEEHTIVNSRPLSNEKRERADLDHKTEARKAAREGERAFIYKKSSGAYRIAPAAISAPHLLHFHFFTLVGENRDWIGFEDGSRWKVPPENAGQVFSWRFNDSLIVTPNMSWGSSPYNYVIHNISANSHSQVYANLSLGSKTFGEFSHWVQALDRDHNQVILENGSLWDISSSDKESFDDWKVNDTIIIGIYDVWFSSYNRILINVNMNHYVRAAQI